MSLQGAGYGSIAFDSSEGRKLLHPAQMSICLLEDGKYAIEGASMNQLLHIIASSKQTDLICELYNNHRQNYELYYRLI
jgi:hypothetical protein